MSPVEIDWNTVFNKGIACLPFYAAMKEMVPRLIDEDTGEINLEAKEVTIIFLSNEVLVCQRMKTASKRMLHTSKSERNNNTGHLILMEQKR